MKYFLLYLLVINLVSFFAMGIDKRKAIKGKWRIPESTLMIMAVIGGSVGAIFGMRVFRHKTKHKKFFIGLPVILILQILLALFIWQQFFFAA